ncbi:MAG TPA: hypothetical protein VF119_01555 [Candidatus Limnocylindrales bacterium]
MDMHPSARLERVLPELIDELAEAHTPDYLEAAIERASSRPQRPAWTFPERWLPMDTVATAQVPTARFPMRALGILALIALLIAGAFIVYTGAQSTPAPPFGLAENGHIAIVSNGDLRAVDQVTGEVTDLVTGPEDDAHPVFSLDGTRLAFQRRIDASTSHVLVAASDGTDATVVTPEPLTDVRTIRFSPTTDQVLIEAARDGVPSFALVGIDGSGFDWLAIDGPAERAAFVPDGGAIVFVTKAADGGEGLARFDFETGQTTELLAAVPQSFIVGPPSMSPDGQGFAFGFWVNNGNATGNARIYTMPVDGSATHSMIPAPLDICCQANPAWSNDGTRIASQRIYGDRQVVATYDATDGGTAIEFVAPSDVPDITVAWSPDDRYVLATYWSAYASGSERTTELQHVVIDATNGALVESAWDNQGPASWQRVGR